MSGRLNRASVATRLLAVSLLLTSLGCAVGARPSVSPLVVDVSGGTLHGQSKNGAYAWLGIPYAAPPVGPLRWRQARDPEPWDGVLEATSMPAPCSQYLTYGETPGFHGAEDCLYLNVYRPSSGDRELPVYVWIHGGANTGGSAREYSGAVLANKIDAVVVIVQYRLGWFGFLSHPALREGAGSAADRAGNFALMDQIRALRWVRDNIAAFGGDPSLVTVAGESAGAYNIAALLAAEPVKRENLFHRAIHMSGAGLATPSLTVAEADRRGELLIRHLAADDTTVVGGSLSEQAAFLYSIDDRTLAEAIIPEAGIGSAVVDGEIFASHVAAQFVDGSLHRVPMIVGVTRDEFKLFYPERDPRFATAFEVVRGRADPSQPLSLSERDRRDYEQITGAVSRLWRAYGADGFAAALSRHADDIFSYRFSWDGDDGSLYQLLYGAAHALDITFFHGDPQSGAFLPFGFNAANEGGRQALSDAIVSYQRQFIRSGDPARGWNGSEPIEWQPWSSTPGEPKWLELDASPTRADIEMMATAISVGEVIREIDAIEDASVKEAVRSAAAGFGFESNE